MQHEKLLPPFIHSGRGTCRIGDEFILSILQNRKPMIDVVVSLNMTVPGIVAHQSALKEGELLKIPQYKYWS